MNNQKAFDAYEVISVISPGVVISLLLSTESLQIRALFGEDGFSVGDLGLFLVISFVLGHLIQSVGNLIEPIVWPLHGLPTNRIRFPNQNLVTSKQRDALCERVCAMESTDIGLEEYSRDDWNAVLARAYARVRNANRSMRVDIANRTYGLFRGLTAAFAVSLLWYCAAHWTDWDATAFLAAMLIAAIWRMRRAGERYARTLVLEFIDLPKVNKPAE